MSQEDLEFVLDGHARLNAGEKRPELWFWHEGAEYHASREDPDSAVHRGIDAIRLQVGSWLDAYPDLKEMELAHVITMRDGRAIRLVEYSDRSEGLEAAGLSD
jgi:hypothetical protein